MPTPEMFTEPEAPSRAPAVAPRIKPSVVRAELDAIWNEAATVREAIGDGEPTAHEWTAHAARIESMGARCKQLARMARALATRAHTEMR